MNQDTVQGNWTELKGKIKAKWGKFTDSDIEEFKGNMQQIAGKIQKTYGYAKEKAEQEYHDFSESIKGSAKSASETAQHAVQTQPIRLSQRQRSFTLSIRNLREVLRGTWTQMSECNLFSIASSLAFSSLLSIVPLLALSFLFIKAVGGMDHLYSLIEPVLFDNLAEGVDEEALKTIQSFVSHVHSGTVGFLGVLGLTITSASLMISADGAVQKVWKAENSRGIFHRIINFIPFVLLGPLALAVGIGLSPGEGQSGLRVFFENVGATVLSGLFLSFVYRRVPNRPVNLRPALIAGFVAAAGFQLAKAGFGLYVRHLSGYGQLYGSLGAIPIFLVWIYLIWLIVLTGVALSAALQEGSEKMNVRS